MPRQIPRNGILFSLANLIALILPSIPRFPNPPGTKIPLLFLNISFKLQFSFSKLSEFTQLIFILV